MSKPYMQERQLPVQVDATKWPNDHVYLPSVFRKARAGEFPLYFQINPLVLGLFPQSGPSFWGAGALLAASSMAR